MDPAIEAQLLVACGVDLPVLVSEADRRADLRGLAADSPAGDPRVASSAPRNEVDSNRKWAVVAVVAVRLHAASDPLLGFVVVVTASVPSVLPGGKDVAIAAALDRLRFVARAAIPAGRVHQPAAQDRLSVRGVADLISNVACAVDEEAKRAVSHPRALVLRGCVVEIPMVAQRVARHG